MTVVKECNHSIDTKYKQGFDENNNKTDYYIKEVFCKNCKQIISKSLTRVNGGLL